MLPAAKLCRHPFSRLLACSVLVVLLASCEGAEVAKEEQLDRLRAINALEEQRYDLARQYLAASRESAQEGSQEPVAAEWLRLEAEAWSSGTLQSATRAVESWRAYLRVRPGDEAARLEEVRALFILGEWQLVADLAADLQSPVALVLRLRALAEIDPRLALAELPRPVADEATLQATAARIYRALDDPEAALEHARRAIELDPLDRQSRYLLARLYQQQGDRTEAGKQLEMQQLLSRFEGTGSVDPPGARERLELLATIGSRLASSRLTELPRSLRFERLRLRVDAGDLAAAAEDLEAFAAAPGRLEISELFELAGLARRVGRSAMARSFLTEALARVDAAEATDRIGQGNWREAIYGLAFLDHENGDNVAARKRLETLIAKAPQYARGYHLLGRLQLGDSDEAAAEASFAKALHLAPWNAACRFDLANLLLSHGKLDEALALIEAAPEPHPDLEQFARRHDQV